MATHRDGKGEAQSPRPPPEAFVEALLRNPLRAEIMRLLDKTPGMNKHQLAMALDVHVNAVEFHVQRLSEAQLVETRPGWKGRETLCFTAENVALWENPATRVLFGRGPPREVARFLAEHPGADVQETAEALGISIHTVRRHLRTLESCDLVQRMRVDQQVIYHAEPELVSWLADVEKDGERKGRAVGFDV